jgi:anti-sigma-K factor RskA
VSAQRPELHLLTGGYTLDALSGAERAAFEKHLAHCGPCADEVKGLRETAGRLAMATAIEPPRQMRALVLAAAPLTRQLPPPGRIPHALAGRRGGNRAARRGGRPSGPRRIGPSRAGIAARRIGPSRAGIAATILALAAAVTFLFVTQVTTQHELQQSQAGNRAIAAVLAAPGARIETVPASVGGSVIAVLSIRQHEAVVTTAGVPAPAGTRVYQLWVMSPSGARSAGLLPASHAGSTAPVLAVGVVAGDRLGVTVEPAGGAAQPTTTPVVVMPVPAVD